MRRIKFESWVSIEDYPDYQVSNLGGVKSLIRKGKRLVRTLKPIINHNGYLCVNLYKDRKKKQIKIHRLVAQAFILNSENKEQVNHKDGNKKNNCIGNLEWVTAKENTNHAIQKLGVSYRGECNSQSKLTKEQVVYIKGLLEIGLPHRRIGEVFSVAHSTVGKIHRCQIWECVL